MADRVCLWGGVSEVVDGLGVLKAAGAGLVLLNPLFDATHHLELLAAEVIPRLT